MKRPGEGLTPKWYRRSRFIAGFLCACVLTWSEPARGHVLPLLGGLVGGLLMIGLTDWLDGTDEDSPATETPEMKEPRE